MTFTLILILAPALVLTLAIVDRRSHREAGQPTLDSYAGVLTDLGPDTDSNGGTDSNRGTDSHVDTGFPGPRWLGPR
ncbi:hypothetical protein [Williamsia sp. M5A3_1d]